MGTILAFACRHRETKISDFKWQYNQNKVNFYHRKINHFLFGSFKAYELKSTKWNELAASYGDIYLETKTFIVPTHVQVISMLRHMIYVLTYTVVTKKMYRKYAFYKNIIQSTVSGCKILGSSEYKTKHDNTVKNGTPRNLVILIQISVSW